MQEVREGKSSLCSLLGDLADAQKTSTVATTDPFKPSAASGRKIGENKLLSARARAAPYAKPGGSRNVNPYSNKCIDCKVGDIRSSCWALRTVADHQGQVAQNNATRCQKCAYKKGLCAICGNIVLNTKGYKQSSK